MRIGIFGGTFDPPHVGHLLAASDAIEALALDRVLLIPAAQQPLKADSAAAPARDRLAMVRAMVEGDARFAVDPVEIERGGLSYTVETLRVLHERWRADKQLALFLLLGADAAVTLPKWREPEAIAALAEIVVLTRSAHPATVAVGQISGQWITTRRVDLSSTEIRARVRAAKSIHGFVPDKVAAYIAGAGLYR
ncbi:MAG TPA: nicotinate-nucleotide adenylyltransferase [Gemmatimonadaceae bacterium]|nr:nicotinate-nucleotide adenylyltransferase [Gemmatimonadaceae bacterium]